MKTRDLRVWIQLKYRHLIYFQSKDKKSSRKDLFVLLILIIALLLSITLTGINLEPDNNLIKIEKVEER
ncbi:Uncharacterised protein [Mycobacteroides abscessus subsp. abscessus]|nr:Uncharacterised protein [Mycobacteroides abscessus subsp. abscessus]